MKLKLMKGVFMNRLVECIEESEVAYVPEFMDNAIYEEGMLTVEHLGAVPGNFHMRAIRDENNSVVFEADMNFFRSVPIQDHEIKALATFFEYTMNKHNCHVVGKEPDDLHKAAFVLYTIFNHSEE